jgi:hypothetical protein
MEVFQFAEIIVLDMKKIQNIKQGLSLMEVVVAIAISMITVTVTSVYTTQLMIASQRNYFESSVNEYESIVVEQLRIIESNLQLAKSKGNPGLISSLDLTFLNSTPMSNATFCGNPGLASQNQLSLKIDLPEFFPLSPTPPYSVSVTPTPFNPRLSANNDYIYDLTEDGVRYLFFQINESQLTGALRTAGFRDVGIALTRIVEGGNGVVDIINIKLKFAYRIYSQNNFRVTKTTDVRMIRDSIC